MSVEQESNRHGFALVIALSLMALILLLLVSLTTLVSIEAQAYQSEAVTLEAHNQSLMGLSIALGELQRFAGPDQRVTTNATVNAELNATSQAGARHWTGVWGNANSPNAAVSAPVLLNWLISGNQRQPLAVSNDGSVTGTSVSFAPDDPIVFNGDNTTVNSQRASVLVGGGTVDNVADSVVVPIVPISGDNGNPVGGYAYWVGDEGIKANVSLTEGANLRVNADSSPLGTTAVRRVQASQGSDTAAQLIETSVDGGSEWGTGYDLNDPGFLSSLDRLGDFPDLSLIASTPQELLGNRFHDITVQSRGVLADSLSGGLKTDLSLAFEMPETDFDQTNMVQQSPDGHVVSFQGVYGPKWKVFRDYYRLYKSVETPNETPLLETQLVTPLPPEDPDLGIPYLFGGSDGDQLRDRTTENTTIPGYPNAHNLPPAVRDVIFPERMKVSPVLADLKFLISVDTELLASQRQVMIGSAGSSILADRKMRLVIDPIVKLWNPYNVRLKFDAFTIRTSHLPLGFKWDIQYPNVVGGGSENYITQQTHLRAFLNKYYGSGFGNFGNWLDSIVVSVGDPEGVVLEPGEVKIFSSGEVSPIPFPDRTTDHMDLVAGWEDQGGYQLDVIDPSNTSTNSQIMADEETEFSVEMTSRSPESGWNFFMISTYLFSEGQYEIRHDVKESSSADFYNTAFYRIRSNAIPFTVSGALGGDTIRSPSGVQRWPLPAPGDKQYLMTIELNLKAEDELENPVPFAQFSPTAYVNSYEQNSVSNLRVGPANTIRYRKINNQADADIQYDATTNRGYYGSSHSVSGQTHVPLLDIPHYPLFSIGQLQNADTSLYAVDPLLAVGNSFASPQLPASELAGIQVNRSRIDTAYLLNRTLWDKYFFSTLAPQDTELFREDRSIRDVVEAVFEEGQIALNPNFKRFESNSSSAESTLLVGERIALDAPERSAAFLLQDGQFNVNSTSKEAWRSFLGSRYRGEIPILERETGSVLPRQDQGVPVSRFSLPISGNDAGNLWEGYRSLSEGELDSLTDAVIDEIRDRGPFLTLGDFVNRDLADGGKRGLLDRAIEAADVNQIYTKVVESSDLNYLPSDARASVEGSRAQGAAKFVLQGDILSQVGHRMATRSDTFRIRAYGEVVSPNTREVIGQSWVEALVQRVPDYVDSVTDLPWEDPSGMNQSFGRRFVITSLRFLREEQI
ncbi:MAG: hypothetical protein AAGJ81_04270 [Verrucomicrobiota bacterium]